MFLRTRAEEQGGESKTRMTKESFKEKRGSE
jgi:hypothetical protein